MDEEKNTNLKAVFDQWTAGMPATKHSWAFIERLANSGLTLEDMRKPKKLLRAAIDNYPGLLLIEQFTALKNLSSSARLATPKSDPELYGILKEAQTDHLAHFESPHQLPRLVVMESDLPSVQASNSCSDEQTIYVSSKSVEIMTRDELKASMLHEYGHLSSNLSVPAYVGFVARAFDKAVTRNAMARTHEYGADSHAVACGVAPEVMASSTRKQTEYTNLFVRSMNDKVQDFLGSFEDKESKIARVVTWVVNKKTQGLRDSLTSYERKTTWLERLCDAPAHPTGMERDEALLGKTEGFKR